MPLRSWESTMRARALLAAMGLLGVIGFAILAPEMEHQHSARHLRPAPDCVDPRTAPWARCEVPALQSRAPYRGSCSVAWRRLVEASVSISAGRNSCRS